MAEKLINITAEKYRCTFGACPAVYKSEDGKTFVFVGEKLDPLHEEGLAGKVSHTEAAVKLPADLLLSSLGIEQLVKASNAIIRELEMHERFWKEFPNPDANRAFIKVPTEIARALREALSSIKGGK